MSLCVAGAVFGEVAVSIFVAGTVFGEGHMILECDFSWLAQCLVKLTQCWTVTLRGRHSIC